MTPRFKAIKKNKNLNIINKSAFERYLSIFKEDEEVSIEIKKWRNKRSSSQNDYYWGVVIPILCKETGYTKDEMHDILKNKFLSKTEKIKNVSFILTKSTTKLDTTEFNDYIEEIKRWAAIFLNTYIPDPE